MIAKWFGFFGLVLVLLSTELLTYSMGLVDGKLNYQHSKNMQMTLDSAYRFGLMDGKVIGWNEGYDQGGEDCKNNFLKLSKKQKRKWCK